MKIKIKTNLVSGILMALFSGYMLYVMPKQVKVPAYDSGAPSPRIIPGICLIVILICSIVLIIAILCIYVFLIIKIGFILASAITFTVVLFYCGERKPFIYIFTIALAVGIYFLFTLVFHVSLPAGILPF